MYLFTVVLWVMQTVGGSEWRVWCLPPSYEGVSGCTHVYEGGVSACVVMVQGGVFGCIRGVCTCVSARRLRGV